MEDDDGTCLLDVLCDPQALNDFLHGTNELPTEDLLINSSSGEASLFADAPSPGSLLGDGVDSPDSPTPGCVDLSFLEEALLSSPEPEEDPPLGPGGTVLDGDPKKAAVEQADEAQVACDILQQSLQEADITEQTMALEAGLSQSGDSLSLYSPAPLLSPNTLQYGSKSVSLPVTPALPRDTQAAVDPPQPSLLAVGPGCPSLKPAAPPQLMGLLPGNVFPAASPEISLSPVNGSSVILHKALPSVQTRPIITQTLRAAPTPASGIVLQRAPLPIQPKLPITIQPRLVQISPKPSGQKPAPGLTFVSGTATSNILLSQPGAQKPAPVPQSGQQLPKPVSLQLVNQAGSFVLQPQGLFHSQNQFLLPGQAPVTIPQPGPGPRQLLTSQGHAVHTVAPSGQLVDGSQILTVPQRQLNFSPVFTTPTGQLALRQATLLSGPLQLQSASPTVFQMPAQLTGTYAAGAQAPRATLVHSPAIGNHITLINSSGVLPPDLTSFSIVNGSSVVQGLPFTHTPVSQATVTEAQLGLQQASVVLLPERAIPEERGPEEAFHLTQSYGQVLQQVSVQPSAGQQPSTPPVVTILQPPPDPPLAPEPAVDMPKLLMASAEISQVVEEVTQLSQNQAFMQQLQQQALTSPLSPELLVGALPVVPLQALSSPLDGDRQVKAEDVPSVTDQCVEGSPLVSHTDHSPLLCSSPSPTDQTQTFTPPKQITSAGQETSLPPPQTESSSQYQLQVPQALFPPQQVQIQPSNHQPLPQVHIHTELSQTQPQPALSQSQVHIQIHDRPQSLPQVQKWSLETPVSQAPLQTSISQSLSLPQAHLQPPPQRSLAPTAASRSPSPAPVQPSVSVPQLQPGPRAAPGVSSGEQPAVQQHTLNKPTAALVFEGTPFTIDAREPSPVACTVPGHGPSHPRDNTPNLTAQLSQQQDNKLEIVPEQRQEQLTPAQRRHRFQQQLCADHEAVQRPSTTAAFCSFQDAVMGLLPYHTCTGHLPSQEHFHQVDQEFDTVSGFLLKRTKDMVNKYRQLLLREALQDIPSAEMVMLERLFLQAERYTLAEDRRRARRDPESFATALSSSSSSSPSDALSSDPSPHPPPPPPPAPPPPSAPPPPLPHPPSSSSPSSSPSWTLLTDRPPGLRTYRSSSRGGLRLTIKHESGSRKVVHNSALKRDHSGQLTNGGRHCQTPNNTALHPVSNGSVEEVPPTDIKIKAPANFEVPPREVSAPKLKCYRLDTPPDQPMPAIQEDNILSEHLQSAIDSILELQRLQGPSASQNRATSGPTFDQAVTSILEGHL